MTSDKYSAIFLATQFVDSQKERSRDMDNSRSRGPKACNRFQGIASG